MNGGASEEPLDAVDAESAVIAPSDHLVPPPPPMPRRRRALPWLIVLVVLLVAAIGGGVALYLQLRDANAALDDANQRIEQQQDQIQQQDDLLDQKQSFGLSMDRLMGVLAKFDGAPTAAIVPVGEIQFEADAAWSDRRSAAMMASHISIVDGYSTDLQAKLDAATGQRDSNATGTLSEAIVDDSGHGFVSTVYDDTATLCNDDAAIGCVDSADPYVVHLDADEFHAPYMDDWARRLIADHEFAHVLQFTNPGPTETALDAFGGDVEFMADCYALTMTNGWTLTHRVTTSRYIYTIDYGYGRVCDSGQRDVIRTWIGELGYRYQPIVQQ